MTPKEKAEELIDKFHLYVRWKMGQEGVLERAKQCAIIAVDEIINVSQDDIHFKHTEFTETHHKYKSYWKLVKQEIETYEHI